MNLSHFCIDRPIFAAVISIVITLAGVVALTRLPIAQYPEITPPVITVNAAYPGASAEVMATNVAAPIEQQINGADRMLYMSSASASGSTSISVYFEGGTDPSLAQVDVQNRINIALPVLPQAVQAQGVQVQKRSSSFMMAIAVFSPDGRFDQTYVANYANIYVLESLKRLPGANQAADISQSAWAMRIWLDPDRMASLGLTATDVQNAVAAQNQQYAVGQLGQSPTGRPVEQQFSVTSAGRMTEPAEFENIILRAANDSAAIVRLKDVGRAELGARDYSVRSFYRGQPTTMLIVYQQPGANSLEVSTSVRASLAEMKKTFPAGLDYAIVMDSTDFTRASIAEVVRTFFESLALVVVVVFLFLQSLRVTLIPLLAVPVSIVGTFVGMTALGYSINMLTLFGLVLAIGIVVDDAIVVIENVERNMTERGLGPKEAAKRAMDEVAGPVIAIVLVMCAVFVPVAFLGGITGALYKQFAITIAISVAISGLVALTLTPALAGLMLEPRAPAQRGFFRWFDRAVARMTNGYVAGVAFGIRRAGLMLLLFAGMGALIWGLYTRIPTAFLPPEDQGFLIGAMVLPDAASLDRTQAVGERVSEFFGKHPATAHVGFASGFSILDEQVRPNAGVFFVGLKPYEERAAAELQAPAIINATAREFAPLREGIVIPINPPSIPGLGTTGGIELWIQSRGEGTLAQLQGTLDEFMAKARARPELVRPTATFNVNSQQLFVDVDRARAETLNVAVSEVYGSLQIMFGSSYVSQFTRLARLWQVIVQGEPASRLTPDDLTRVYVRSRDGKMLPLSSMVTTRYVTGPAVVSRFNNYPAVKVTADIAPGFSTGQGIATMRAIAAELPSGYAIAWSGQSYEETQSGGTSALVFVFGLVMVFLILAAQYEKWSLPLAVLLAVPFALAGALLAIWLRGIDNDVYFQIGLTMLIALAAKNAILIVEFAVLNRAQGMSARDAALAAARERLRPIVMTSAAFILGVVPLAIATGAAANSRHSIGTGVIGGMLGATVVAIFFIPLFYWLIETAGDKLRGRRQSAAGGGAPLATAPQQAREGD